MGKSIQTIASAVVACVIIYTYDQIREYLRARKGQRR